MRTLLWLEGVDFDETLFDTNHLSVLRGGSLALLAAASEAQWFLEQSLKGVEPVFGAASLALFRLPCDVAAARSLRDALLRHLHNTGVDVEAIRRAARRQFDPTQLLPPFAYMRFVAGVAEETGTATAPRLAQAEARVMQMQGTAPRRASTPAIENCRFSLHAAADSTLELKPDHAAKYGVVATGDTNATVPVSRAVAARWYYGRRQRQLFYRDSEIVGEAVGKLISEGHSFTDNLQDMIDLGCSPEFSKRQEAVAKGNHDLAEWLGAAQKLHEALPRAVRGKMAVLYADGNEFTAIRTQMGGNSDALKQFSDAAKPTMQKMLAAVVNVVAAGAQDGATTTQQVAARYYDFPEEGNSDGIFPQQLRFETLLYGGDEVCFVVPAWFGLAMAKAFFEVVKGAEVAGHPLTFKAGLVFAPVKMPIRVARGLAKDLADSVKQGRSNRLGIHAFESVEPPANGLMTLRKGLFGEALSESAKAQLAIDGDMFAETGLDNLIHITGDDGFPRSQLFRLLRGAQWMDKEGRKAATPRKLGDPDAGDMAHELLKDYGKPPDGFWGAALDDPKASAVAAWAITHLWDYVAPVDRAAEGMQ